MSNIPEIDKPKYNKDNKFAWVDSQLEKFMERQKEDAEYIENLEGGVSEMKKRIKELEGELRNLKKYFKSKRIKYFLRYKSGLFPETLNILL